MATRDSHTRESIMNKMLEGRGWFLICAFIAVLAGISRFLFLAEKPYHHDESLHAYYSHRVAQGNPHEYSALLHGPVLYYLVGTFMAIFGAGEFIARFPAALCSVALVVLPLFWSRSIGRAAAVCISMLLLLSPTFMYFGRFLREDSFNSLWIGCSLAGFFAYHWWGKPWHAIAGSAFLAMQFCNKENSYLHLFVWLTGVFAVLWLIKRSGLQELGDLRGGHQSLSSWSDRLALVLNCVSVFAVIFVLFYSSFFRHSKGAMNGILDGLYRESLLYWWDQNQKRRIDGPFDYHFPLILNYEFALLPALFAAWLRAVFSATRRSAISALRFPFSWMKNRKAVLIFSGLLLSLIALPRVGLTSDGCVISEFCGNQLFGESLATRLSAIAKLLHLAHTRHLLQLLSIAFLGAIAVIANAALRRFLDGFLWWWATGMLGIYSYVGEKVPWLLLYILLPLVMLAGLELGRLLGAKGTLTLLPERSFDAKEREILSVGEERFNFKVARLTWIVSLLFLVFATWKAVRVSFPAAASPQERLVFTQTTPAVKLIRERWVAMSRAEGRTPKVTMSGDSTWPMAWYGHDLPGLDFIQPANTAAAEPFDAIFLDTSALDFARQALQSFDIYKVPLRHWWVPQPNPRIDEIFEYFLTSRPYPRELRNSPLEQGIGDTSVLYLENRRPGRFFAEAAQCECGEKVESAKLPGADPVGGSLDNSRAPAERKN